MLSSKGRKRPFDEIESGSEAFAPRGFRIIDIGMLQAALDDALLCGHGKLMISDVPGSNNNLFSSFKIQCKVCSFSSLFSNSPCCRKGIDRRLNVELENLLTETYFRSLVEYFDRERQKKSLISEDSLPSKQAKKASFEEHNGLKNDTEVRGKTVSNDSEKLQSEDSGNTTGDNGEHFVIKSEDMDVVVKAEPEDLDDLVEEEEDSGFNPQLFLSVDDLKTDEDYNHEGVDPLNTQMEGGWHTVLGGKVRPWPIEVPVEASPNTFIKTTCQKYNLAAGLYQYIRNNGLRSVLVVKEEGGDYDDIFQFYNCIKKTKPHLRLGHYNETIVEKRRKQLHANGFVQCEKCSLAYLSLRGALRHEDRCKGTLPRDYFTCSLCQPEIKFSQEIVLMQHIKKTHPGQSGEKAVSNRRSTGVEETSTGAPKSRTRNRGSTKPVSETPASKDLVLRSQTPPGKKGSTSGGARKAGNGSLSNRGSPSQRASPSQRFSPSQRSSPSQVRVKEKSNFTVQTFFKTPAKDLSRWSQHMARNNTSESLSKAANSRRTPLSIFSNIYSCRLKAAGLSHNMDDLVIDAWMKMNNEEKEIFKEAVFNEGTFQKVTSSPDSTAELFRRMEKRIYSTVRL